MMMPTLLHLVLLLLLLVSPNPRFVTVVLPLRLHLFEWDGLDTSTV